MEVFGTTAAEAVAKATAGISLIIAGLIFATQLLVKFFKAQAEKNY
jgi:hypothetical protein